MRDRWIILTGFGALAALLTLPVWLNLGLGTQARPPVLDRPAGETACVAPTAYMRASHMQLLAEWREAAVRRAIRTWTGPDGRTHRTSLTGTCLRCHERKAGFCDRCHGFVGVAPGCWQCHVDPAQARKDVS